MPQRHPRTLIPLRTLDICIWSIVFALAHNTYFWGFPFDRVYRAPHEGCLSRCSWRSVMLLHAATLIALCIWPMLCRLPLTNSGKPAVHTEACCWIRRPRWAIAVALKHVIEKSHSSNNLQLNLRAQKCENLTFECTISSRAESHFSASKLRFKTARIGQSSKDFEIVHPKVRFPHYCARRLSRTSNYDHTTIRYDHIIVNNKPMLILQ